MTFIKFLFGRTLITSLLIFAQLALLILFWFALSEYYPIIGTIFTIISLLIVLKIISHGGNLTFKIGWIIIILLLPILGGALYLFFGRQKKLKRLSRKIESVRDKYSKTLVPDESILKRIESIDARAAGGISYLQSESGFPVWENSQTIYYPLGEEMYAAMVEELNKAQKFIFLEYFIISGGVMWEGIYNILKEKAKVGLDVRIIYDDLGSISELPSKFRKTLENDGIKCVEFNPFLPILSIAMNNRDHRKILVVDGKCAFTGGINIADEYINVKKRFGHWKDSGVKITGEAVWSFIIMFLEMWNAFRKTDNDTNEFKNSITKVNTDGFVQPFGSSPFDHEPINQNLYVDLLNRAVRYTYITTPYIAFDYEIQNALSLAAKRGVDVRIITPGIADKMIVHRLTRSYYGDLIKNGIKIYEYTPGFIHSKCYVSDDESAVVGTINMDYRSLYLHFECGVYQYKTSSIKQLKDDFIDTLTKCREIKSGNLKKTFSWTLFDRIMRIFAPLM